MTMVMDYRTKRKLADRMIEAGRQRALTNLNRALARGDAASTQAGLAVTRRALAPLTEAIRTFTQEALHGKAGRRNTAAVLLLGVDPEVAAYLTVRVAVSACISQARLHSTAKRLARALDDELAAARFEAANPGLYHSIVNRARERGMTESRIPNSLRRAEREFGIATERWTQAQQTHIGTALLDLAVNNLEIFGLVQIPSGHGSTEYRIVLKDNMHAWFQAFNQAALLTRPVFMPCDYKPLPWINATDGGYAHLRKACLLGQPRSNHLDLIEQANMSVVYKAINAVQETAWRMNARILATAAEAWENNIEFPSIPAQFNPELQPMPEDIAALPLDHPKRREWRRNRADAHQRDRSTNSERATFIRKMNLAKEYGAHTEFYFPHKLDFRGRLYPISDAITPQGDDFTKSLLTFAVTKPLGDTGVDWLAVHGANCWGNDKVSFADRRTWSFTNAGRIMSVARDPFADRWWTEASSPWQFLAWCFEFSAMLTNPGGWAEYKSALPVGLDGSCNGLQHFAAMLRDPDAAAAVNLIPSDTPQDVYQRVADRVMDGLRQNTHYMAEGWYKWGIDRKITKRSVMVLPYGGTFTSCKSYVSQAVYERIEGGAANPFGDELDDAILMLARGYVWPAMQEVVSSAATVMDWLRHIAGVWTAAGRHVLWTAPSGFPALQHYPETRIRRIATRFNGSTLAYRHYEEIEGSIDRRRHRTSLPPNFVHSLDAAALVLTVDRCVDLGITSLMMIHDSYGTHAADVQTMADVLREVFVSMYENHDPLADLYHATLAFAECPVDPPPVMGDLDLRLVQSSQYFFA